MNGYQWIGDRPSCAQEMPRLDDINFSISNAGGDCIRLLARVVYSLESLAKNIKSFVSTIPLSYFFLEFQPVLVEITGMKNMLNQAILFKLFQVVCLF